MKDLWIGLRYVSTNVVRTLAIISWEQYASVYRVLIVE